MKPEMDLEAMKNVDVRTVDRDTLADIRDVHIDTSLPQAERLMDFIKQIGNPYCYRCGKAVVKISFVDNGATLEDKLEHFLKTL